MHSSASMKILTPSLSNSVEKNDSSIVSRSYNSTPKIGPGSNNNAQKTNWSELEITGQICNLSPSLFKFSHLTKLILRNNSLTFLPSDISNLENLTILDVTNNRLQSVPSKIGDIISLKELLLNNNCLKTLPYELGKLFQIVKLGLKGNPLPNKYLTLCAESPQKLISYFLDHLPSVYIPLPERAWISVANIDNSKPSAVFTVMCYNILCDKYCTRSLYGYCPPWALMWDYRKKNIMTELKKYDADIISLQEVETEQFYNFFQGQLELQGYKGIFSPKSRARTMLESERKHVDGCAIFYKNNKFRAIKDHLVEFNQLAIETADGSHDMINRVMTKDNIGLAAILETTSEVWQNGLPTDTSPNLPVMIATCHVHWDPEFCDVKLIQTMMLMHRLQNIIKEAGPSIMRPHNETDFDCNALPLILCGDLNSMPESGVVEFLKSGRINANHKDFKDIGYDDCLFKLSQTDNKGHYTHGFKLNQVYTKEIMPFTNYTFDFRDVIDYIFHSRESLRCLGMLASPDSNWFVENRIHGCPHPQFPSDHLPLLAQFELLPPRRPNNPHLRR